MNTYTFVGVVSISPSDNRNIEIQLEAESELDLLWDDVYDNLCEKLDIDFPEEFYPKAEITDIFLKMQNSETNEMEFYPVIAIESEKQKYIEKGYKKILVLDGYSYSLSDEYFLFETLKENGLIPDDTEFNYDVMHTIINNFRNHLKNKNK